MTTVTFSNIKKTVANGELYAPEVYELLKFEARAKRGTYGPNRDAMSKCSRHCLRYIGWK